MDIHDDIVHAIGGTPMVRLGRIHPPGNLVAKLEFLNPGGSGKDRIGLAMIESLCIYALVISLILIYAHKGQGEKIKAMMRERHPESRHVATDRQFVNPFGRVERRRRPHVRPRPWPRWS